MTIAIHQPNYMPWLGYFYKIYSCDVFVFHDVVPFSKASFTKRCKIREDKASSQTAWLSLPVQHHAQGTPIGEIRISPHQHWVQKHLRKVSNTYSSAPFFTTYCDWLREVLQRAHSESTLADANILIARAVAELLAVRKEYRRSSEMELVGKGTALNLEIAKQLGATEYLAGAGSRNYEDVDAFRKENIRITRHDLGAWLNAHPYDQGTGQFTGGLSVIDALMHVGVVGIKDCFEKFDKSRQWQA